MCKRLLNKLKPRKIKLWFETKSSRNKYWKIRTGINQNKYKIRSIWKRLIGISLKIMIVTKMIIMMIIANEILFYNTTINFFYRLIHLIKIHVHVNYKINLNLNSKSWRPILQGSHKRNNYRILSRLIFQAINLRVLLLKMPIRRS